ncbi:sugar phosphate isomerase/epimerase family protein [Corynebacterium halotolerans]|uniref:sugar phosphate isomerase/epimerase family protein n=1 Tax=Corynebacterium halotolerans TaxID=225326 RepID=UPI003CF05383
MTIPSRPLGLAALSLLSTPPDEFVRIAADAGFDFVGLRVRRVTDAEPDYDLSPGSALQRRTLAALRDTGLQVIDTEFLLLDGSDQREQWLQALEAAAGLGAETLTVAAADTDQNRLRDTLSRIVADGTQFGGIRPALEAISYQAVNSIPQAAELAAQTGACFLPDTLHLSRFGGTTGELSAAADLVPMLQLCDGPAKPPADRSGLVLESRAERRSPGDGDFALVDYVAALPAATPVSVETPSDSGVVALGPAGWAEKLYVDTRAMLDRVPADIIR